MPWSQSGSSIRSLFGNCMKTIGAVLEFLANTLNTVALALLVAGFLQPIISDDGNVVRFGLLIEAEKLEDLRFAAIPPIVDLNWLLISLSVYVGALLAKAFSYNLTN